MVYQAKALTTLGGTQRAELNDLYGQVIYETLNLTKNFYKMVPKVKVASDRFGYRVRTAKNPTAVSYQELDVIGTGNATRQRRYFPIKLTKVGVEVSGFEIAAAKDGGGVGDIWAEEIRVATEDYGVAVDTMLCGSADPNSSNDVSGLQYLIAASGTYGDVSNRAAAGYEWAVASVDATAEDLSITRMRTMMRTNVVAGAKKENLVFWCHPLQLDKYKDLIQDMQRTVPTSTRVGYEGEASLDGTPIMTDIRLTSSELYCLDMDTIKLGMLEEPNIQELPEPKDAKAAYIKSYLQMVCTVPKFNYKKTALTT